MLPSYYTLFRLNTNKEKTIIEQPYNYYTTTMQLLRNYCSTTIQLLQHYYTTIIYKYNKCQPAGE